MRTERFRNRNLVAAFGAIFAVLFLVACQQSQPPAPAPTETKASVTEVYVIFEGPWAIVPDPKDANSVLALSPKSKSHRPLAVVPTNKTLESGVYELQIPEHGHPAAPSFDKGVFRTKVDPQATQRALDDRLERYAVRLPKPEAYLAETRHRSRVGSSYPPDPSTEMDYVTSISLRYSVTSVNGFSLTGTQDVGGAFAPQLLSLDTPIVRFEIIPSEDHSNDPCNTHARKTFHELTQLLGLTLFVDFPDDPSDCHKKDPQLAHSEKAQLLRDSGTDLGAGLSSDDPMPAMEAGMFGGVLPAYINSAVRSVEHGVVAAYYFFHTGAGACISPAIVGDNGG